MRGEIAVIPSRADGEGPPSRSLRYTKKDQAWSDENALRISKAIERLRGPSVAAATSRMTCVQSHLGYPHRNE